MSDSRLKAFPVFHARPDDEYVNGWHEFIRDTGEPENYQDVSTTKPEQTENVVLLSGETRVPVARRLEKRLVPCPICSPENPKFLVGRMAWFPDEKTVRFIGHDCASRHFGEAYDLADARYKLEARCMFEQSAWREMELRLQGLKDHVAQIKGKARAIESLRETLDEQARGFAAFLHSTFLRANGSLSFKEPTGARDGEGKMIFKEIHLGRVVGLSFLKRNFRPLVTLKAIEGAQTDLQTALPPWRPDDGESEAAKEILKRGRRARWMLITLRTLTEDLANAPQFLLPQNLQLLERWVASGHSPFKSLTLKHEGEAVLIRGESYEASYFCNLHAGDPSLFDEVVVAGSVLEPLTSTFK